MKKLSNDELLEKLDEEIKYGKEFLKAAPNVKEWQKELQFYQQIRQMIKDFPAYKERADAYNKAEVDFFKKNA